MVVQRPIGIPSSPAVRPPVARPTGEVEALRPVIKDQYQFTPRMPAYKPLSAPEIAAAEQRSSGSTYAQRNIKSAGGYVNEPISTVLTGTQEEIMAAFEAAGWTEADPVNTVSGLKTIGTLISEIPWVNKHWNYQYNGAPVSDQFLDGKVYDMAFEKNSIHDLCRDHVRLYNTGRKDATGRPVWEMATTRDYGVLIEPKQKHSTHLVDTKIDLERDQVLADLLGSGEVGNWAIATGVQAAEDRAATQARFQTDGRVYQVELKARPDLTGSILYKQPSAARKLLSHAPTFIQNGVHAADARITKVIKKLTG